MQSFIFALLLAGVSGVTVVAFRHPNGYARLFPYMLVIISVVFVCITIWQAAVEITWHRVDHFIAEGVLDKAESRKSDLNLPYAWVLFWYLATVSFLWVNLKLPPFLQVTDPADTDIEKSDAH